MKQPHAAIARNARLTRWCVIVLLAVIALLPVLALGPVSPHIQLHGLGYGMIGGAIVLVHTVLMILALVQLLLLFTLLEKGELFSAGVTLRVRRFASLTVLAVLSVTVALPLAVLLFVDCGAADHCARRLPINMQGLWTLVISLLFFLVARILDEARRIEEDNRQII